MSDQVTGRVILSRPDAFNEVFNALRKIAGKNNHYLGIHADKLLTFVVGNPYDVLTEVTMQPEAVQYVNKNTPYNVTNFKVEIPFSLEMISLEMLKKLTKFKATDTVIIERIHPESNMFKDVVRLTVNGFVDEFGIADGDVFPTPNAYLESMYQRPEVEPKKQFNFLNKAANGTIEAQVRFGKLLGFLAKNYLESGGRAIVNNVFIGRNKHTDEHFYNTPIIGATNGYAAYVNMTDTISNDEEFFVHIPRNIADALGSVMSNTKLFSGRASPERSKAWEGRVAYPQPAEKGFRNFISSCKILHAQKVEVTDEVSTRNHLQRIEKAAFFQFTANETLAHFTVMLRLNEDFDGYLDAIDGVFAPCLETRHMECAPKIDIEEFAHASERVAKGSNVTLKDIEDTITCEAAVLNKGDPLGSFSVDNDNNRYPPEGKELCLNTEYLRTAGKALQLDGATSFKLFSKEFLDEKDGVVLITGENEATPFVALMQIRK